MSVLLSPYETWLAFRDSYRVEYPNDGEADTG